MMINNTFDSVEYKVLIIVTHNISKDMKTMDLNPEMTQ